MKQLLLFVVSFVIAAAIAANPENVNPFIGFVTGAILMLGIVGPYIAGFALVVTKAQEKMQNPGTTFLSGLAFGFPSLAVYAGWLSGDPTWVLPFFVALWACAVLEDK